MRRRWHVQLTISSYLFGFAVGQIFYGPISDRFGRRPVLLAALVLYGFASIGCVVAQSIDGLIAMRFLQAVGGAGAIVLARAVVRDLYSGVRAGRELSLMGAITGVAPIVAPMIGGVVADHVRLARDFCVARDLCTRRGNGGRAAVAGDVARARAGAILAARNGRAVPFGRSCIAAFLPISPS